MSGDSDNEFRHGIARCYETRPKACLSAPSLCRTALIPIASHSRFVCAGFPFSERAIGLWAGFSLKGETDGIQTTVLSTFLLYSTTLIRLGHSFGLVVGNPFVFTLRRPKRNMSE